MLYIIIIITFVVILLINFTVDFIKNRQLFKQKNKIHDNILTQNFYDKYNKNPVIFDKDKESLLNYDPLTPLDNIVINNNKKIFIINSYINLINSIISNNNYLTKINPLLYRNKISKEIENLPRKTKKNSKKKIIESMAIIKEVIPLKDIDFKNIILKKNYKKIQLNRIIDYYFTSLNENLLKITINQEYLLDNKKNYITTELTFDSNNNLLLKINDTDLFNDNNFQEFNYFMNLKNTIENLNIVSTVLGVISSIETQEKNNILMIKNIKPEIYNELINYCSFDGQIVNIKNLSIDLVFDNIYRCFMILELNFKENKKSNDKTKLVEQYFDFECPGYSMPQLISVYHKKEK